MPVTVNANGSNFPPQMEVTISTSDGSTMTSLALTRIAGGVKTATRVQPLAGFASRYLTDPESPWDAAVTYQATYATATLGTITETSAPATLTPTPAAVWAIHPTIPALSMALDAGDFSVAGLSEISEVIRAAQATQHQILGGDLPLLTKLGNRKAPATQLSLTTVTEAERQKAIALLKDETPLLIRAPAAWAWGWEEGYYAVGDAAFARRLMYGPEPSRSIRLPINQVQAPAGVQQSDWSFPGLATGYADFGQVTNRFADWNALTGNNPT